MAGWAGRSDGRSLNKSATTKTRERARNNNVIIPWRETFQTRRKISSRRVTVPYSAEGGAKHTVATVQSLMSGHSGGVTSRFIRASLGDGNVDRRAEGKPTVATPGMATPDKDADAQQRQGNSTEPTSQKCRGLILNKVNHDTRQRGGVEVVDCRTAVEL